MTTEQGNLLIAEFDGMTYKDVSMVNYPKDYKVWRIKFPNGQQFEQYGNLQQIVSKYSKYHTSWDWLMPVVEKIPNKNDYHFLDEEAEKVIKELKEALFNVDIEKAWSSVVKYIKWYSSLADKTEKK